MTILYSKCKDTKMAEKKIKVELVNLHENEGTHSMLDGRYLEDGRYLQYKGCFCFY